MFADHEGIDDQDGGSSSVPQGNNVSNNDPIDLFSSPLASSQENASSGNINHAVSSSSRHHGSSGAVEADEDEESDGNLFLSVERGGQDEQNGSDDEENEDLFVRPAGGHVAGESGTEQQNMAQFPEVRFFKDPNDYSPNFFS